MLKQSISTFLRQVHLLYPIDYLVYGYKKVKNYKTNKRFTRLHPEVSLPPDYLIYESFQLDYNKYYTDSVETAQWLTGIFRKHTPLYNMNILDWGCGPARIIRHLPSMIGSSCLFFGTDYNPRTISWCQKNIPGVTFSVNSLEPPLEFNQEFFHIIYGISIFTHLSEPMHKRWIDELSRLLVPGGILVITTQGVSFRSKLTLQELQEFDKGKLVVRGKVKEGHRTFSAFQPKEYMNMLLLGFEVLEMIEGELGGRPQQDVWIVKKTKLPAD